MSTGKIQYLNRLVESDFPKLIDNLDGTTVIMGIMEDTWTNMYADHVKGQQLMDDFNNTYKNLKPDIKMILCGYDYPEEIQDEGTDTPDMFDVKGIPWAERILWSTHWFGRMVTSDLKSTDPGILTTPPDKLFSCFLNRGHKYHRMALMLSLIDNNMMDLGEVRFCNNDTDWDFFTSMVSDDDALKKQDDWNRANKPNVWKKIPERFLPHKELLSKLKPYMNKIRSEYTHGGILDPAYHNCMIDIIGMSDTVHLTFDEKVARPLLFGKPFYSVGPPDCNVRLKDFGFEIYTELFDYVNDNHFTDSYLMRPKKNEWVSGRRDFYNDILKPFYNLDGSPECIREVFEITRQKALYNQKRFVDIVFDDSFIPDILPKNMRNEDYEVAVTMPRKLLKGHDYFRKLI
jgi:hypothetical protein